MVIETMATSLVLGKARGGKIRNIGETNIRGWYFFLAGFGVEFVSVLINSRDLLGLSQFLNNYFIYIHGISYLMIFAGLILNFNKKSMILIFIGTLLNLIVIMANSGQMPVSGEGLQLAGLLENLEALKSQSVITHTLITENTRFSILGDIIRISKPYPFPKLLSIGDIFIAIGVFFFLQKAMVIKGGFQKNKMINFEYKGTKKIRF